MKTEVIEANTELAKLAKINTELTEIPLVIISNGVVSEQKELIKAVDNLRVLVDSAIDGDKSVKELVSTRKNIKALASIYRDYRLKSTQPFKEITSFLLNIEKDIKKQDERLLIHISEIKEVDYKKVETAIMSEFQRLIDNNIELGINIDSFLYHAQAKR
jgi:hypothetical protein